MMNEIGLDPGIDHLLAMRFIDATHARNAAITSFVSWCGGLPAPENSDNPLGYKFSWSPRGVLTAAMNSAKFRRDGQLIEIPAGGILDAAERVEIYRGFNFEGLANRDSLKYVQAYGLNERDLETMFRGTLRYAGFASLMRSMRDMGLLSVNGTVDPTMTWVRVD